MKKSVLLLGTLCLGCFSAPALAGVPSSTRASGMVASKQPASGPALIRAPLQMPSSFRRWAIVASPEVQRSGLPEVLSAELSERTGLQLVERDAIDRIVRELSVNELLSSESPAARLQLGQLLGADRLILLSTERGAEGDGSTTLLRLSISETVHGARLRSDLMAHEGDRIEEQCARIGNLVYEVDQSFLEGVCRIIAVPAFVLKNITDDFKPLRWHFAHLLESALATYPGTAVLEIQEAEAIRREQEMTNSEVRGRVLPAFVQGEFRVDSKVGQQDVQLTLRVTRGNAEEVLKWRLTSIDEVVATLRREAPAKIMHVPSEKFQQSLSVEQQVALLTERADVFARRGEVLTSTPLREAALLLSPDDPRQNEVLVREHLFLSSFWSGTTWQSRSEARSLECFQEYAAHWRRAVAILEQIIRKDLLHDRRKAQDLAWEVRKAINSLMASVGPVLAGEDRDFSPATLEVFRQERARCAETYRRFVRESVPLIGMLRFAYDTKPVTTTRPVDAKLLDLALELNCEETSWRDLTKRDLDHYAHVLADLACDQAVDSTRILGLMKSMGTQSDLPRSFTDEEYIDFLSRLANSGLRMPELYAQLGHLLYDYRCGQGPTRSDPLTTVRALEKWQREVAEHLGRKGAVHESLDIRRIRDAVAPLYYGKDTALPLPPRVNPRDQHQINQVSFEPIQMKVRQEPGAPLLRRDEHGVPDWMICAGSRDVFWNLRTAWLHREPGVLDRIVTTQTGDWLYHVAWDGQYIWIIRATGGVSAYTSDGSLVAHAGSREGLPPAERGGRLAPLSPGRVVAVGSVGLMHRAWCATLVLHQDEIEVDVFHEAVIARARTAQEGISWVDPSVTFAPYMIYRAPSGGDARLLLVCGEESSFNYPGEASADYELWVYPDRRVVEKGGDVPRGRGDRVAHYFLSNGNCLLAHDNTISVWTAPANRGTHDEHFRVIHRNDDRSHEFYGYILECQNYLYVPGRRWVRVDPRSLSIEALGDGPVGRIRFGVSGLLGLVSWSDDGFRRVVIRPLRPETTEMSKDDAAKLAAFDAAIARSPSDEQPHQAKVSTLYNADLLEGARAAALAWVQMFPFSMEARSALIDIERKVRSGLNPDESNEQWEEYPHATFAAWSLFNSPGCGGGSAEELLNKAVHLPFAASQLEWYIAEVAVYDAAQFRYRFGRYRQCVEICDAWEVAARAQPSGCDRSYLGFRAAARLCLGEFDRAIADAAEAVRHEAAGHLWSANAAELLRAAQTRQRAFKYHCDASGYTEWLLDNP